MSASTSRGVLYPSVTLDPMNLLCHNTRGHSSIPFIHQWIMTLRVRLTVKCHFSTRLLTTFNHSLSDTFFDITTSAPSDTVVNMPTYRSITISVVSQFDIKDIPEYPPPKNPKDPFSGSPTVLASERGVASVYIPTFPSSRFWLSYSIYPPYPPKAFYYFKLFLNGVCVQSWGCGEDDKYKGKTMFGMFDSGEVFFGERAVEKRILCFASEGLMAEKTPDKLENYVDDPKDVMEVRVYRSKGRKRIRPEVESYENVAAAKNSTLKRPKEEGGGGIR